MSYREENDQVILTMSREDYEIVMTILRQRLSPERRFRFSVVNPSPMLCELVENLLNRLNSGNPHYTPYQVKTSEDAPPKR
jgi:hypothetical protein